MLCDSQAGIDFHHGLIGPRVGCGTPLAERAERIVGLATTPDLGQDDALIDDFVEQLVARLEPQRGANWPRNGGLRFGRQCAGDHGGA